MANVTSIHDLAAAVRVRSQALQLSQAEVARRAGVSRQWVSEFETGKPTAELRLVLRLLDALERARLARDAFADAVRAPDVSALRRELPSRLLNLVADRARRCLRMLDRGTPSGGG